LTVELIDITHAPFASHTIAQGPRQMLLEAAPCSQCSKPFSGEGKLSVICDRCNAPFHLKCVRLTNPPPTYWYCQGCSSHIAARGLQCPTEDVLLHRYLLGMGAPPELRSSFQQ
jgi:hypothetical protein